jgi:hypothetical protein
MLVTCWTLHRHCLKKLRKLSARIFDNAADIRSRHLQISSVERYRYANQLHCKNKEEVNLSMLNAPYHKAKQVVTQYAFLTAVRVGVCHQLRTPAVWIGTGLVQKLVWKNTCPSQEQNIRRPSCNQLLYWLADLLHSQGNKIYIYLGQILRRPRFDPRSDHVEFVVDKLTLGHAFPKYFSSPTNFHSTEMLYTHLSYRPHTAGQLVGDVPSGHHEIKKIIK